MSVAAFFYILIAIAATIVSFKMGFHCGYEYRDFLTRSQVARHETKKT